MKTVLRIVWRVLPFVMVIVPFVIAYLIKLEEATKLFHFYMIASFVLVAGLIGVALYEDQWEGDPGQACRTIRIIIIIAMVILTFLGVANDKTVLEGTFCAAAVVMLLSIALYFFFLQIASFESSWFFFVVGVITVVAFLALPSASGGMVSDVLVSAFGAVVGSYVITFLMEKFLG